MFSLICIITVVALSVVVYRQGNELQVLKPQVKQLNEERGTLVIEDSRLVHAIQVPSRFATNDGTYRVFIPENESYVAMIAINDIPQTGYPLVPKSNSYNMLIGQTGKYAFARLNAGEHLVSLHLQQQNGKKHVRLEVDGLDMLINLPPNTWPEVSPLPYTVFESDSVRNKTSTVARGQPLILKRHRIAAAPEKFYSFSTPDPPSPLQGMMLWIEPLKEGKCP